MTLFKSLSLFGTLLLFAACSQPAVKALQPEAVATQQAAADAAAEEVANAAKAKLEAAYPKQALTPDILFKFLVAEVAGQRGAMGVAQPAYMDLARQTRDPRIAQRAAEMAQALLAEHMLPQGRVGSQQILPQRLRHHWLADDHLAITVHQCGLHVLAVAHRVEQNLKIHRINGGRNHSGKLPFVIEQHPAEVDHVIVQH